VLRNCKSCGELFVSKKVSLCKRCMEEAYVAVKAYLQKNPKSSIPDVVRDTGVSLSIINSIVMDGRLSL